MRSSLRLLVPLGVIVLLAGAVSVYRAGSAITPREDPAIWAVPDEVRRAEKLQARQRLIFWRLGEKGRISQELAAGRCTLLEAAGQYRALYRGDPIIGQFLPNAYPGATDEERYCRWVITYTRVALEDRPETAELAARLEAELQAHLDRGTLRLPE